MSGKRLVPRDDRISALLTAAQSVFAKKGYHAATVDDITRAAGVAKGTFYLYFQEKREIYYAVIQGFLALIKDIGRSDSEHARGDDYVSQAESAAHEVMKVFLENRELARLAYRESMGLDAELEKIVRDFYREIAEVEAANIRLGVELGLLRAGLDPLLVAYAHIGMAERVLLVLLEDGPLPPPDRIVKDLVQLAFEGLIVRR
jgi:AcrR family transcriptional regulator